MSLATYSLAQNGYRRLIGICFVLLLSCCFPLAAQVNIFTGETMKQMQLDPGWYNSIALDLTYRTGNTDLLTTRGRFRIRLSLKEVSRLCFWQPPVRSAERGIFYQ